VTLQQAFSLSGTALSPPYNSLKKHFEVKQLADNDKLQDLEASLEALKELVCSQQVHIRETDHERDLLMWWYRALLVQSTSTNGEHPVQTLH
jgi:hypothetical protein